MKSDEAYKALRNAILTELYDAAYNKIQSLGGPGFHSDNMINRQDALNALFDARHECKNK